ncbi:MAG: YbjN domain-containing protein [Rhizobiales bacterium PAR1]|nr:MAG: YbjN domain-containing protein [Rhizobiales bacterium PAR1]
MLSQTAKGLNVALKPFPRHPDSELIAASTTDIEKTVEIAKAHGEVTFGKDSSGDPQIKVKSKTGNWVISYYSCTKGEDCKTMQFYYGISTKNKVSAAKINEWNRTKRWAKAYLDKDGDPNISFDVLSRYGVSRAMLNASMALWVDIIDDFKTTMTKD